MEQNMHNTVVTRWNKVLGKKSPHPTESSPRKPTRIFIPKLERCTLFIEQLYIFDSGLKLILHPKHKK